MTLSQVYLRQVDSRQVELRRQGVPSVPVRPEADRSGFERPSLLKKMAALADPLRSESVKGWLLGELRAPE
jgi:hypothetical protein